MAKGLTDRQLQSLITQPPKKRVELPDGTIDGLIVRAGPRGKPTWTFRYRLRGAGGMTARGTALNGSKYLRLNLGYYPAVTIKAARKAAAQYAEAVERGDNPAEDLEGQAIDRRDTVRALVDDYVAHARETMRSWRNAKWTLERHVVAAWGDRPAGTITHRDAERLIASVLKGEPDLETGESRQRRGAAAETRKWGSMLFSWGAQTHRVRSNPFADVKAPRLRPRQRFLSIEEARAVWKATAQIASPWSEALQLLMLTACRESEICGARRSWLDGAKATFLIPHDMYKSERHMLVPLVPEAMAVVGKLPDHEDGDFMISTTEGEKPVAGIARKTMDDLHAHAEKILERKIEHFRLHDLRRTVRTHLARLGVSEVVAELVLGHKLKGLQGTYNVYDFASEKRQALERWASELTARPESPVEDPEQEQDSESEPCADGAP